MKVLDLQCPDLHVFEGWFASEADFITQLERGLVTCPVCGHAKLSKKLSAPRLNLNTARGDRETAGHLTDVNQGVSHAPQATASEPAVPLLPSLEEVASLEPAQLQATLLKMVRHVVANTEDVGNSFPEEARKMHYGETEHRNIRGHATPEETEALLDEGIQVMPLPMPDALKGPLQ